MAVLVKRREKWLWAGFALLVVLALSLRWWMGGEMPAAPPPAATPASVPAYTAAAGPAFAPGGVDAPAADDGVAVEEDGGEEMAPERDLAAELQAIANAIRTHLSRLGALPAGGNAAVAAALTGANAQGAALLPADHPALQSGLLVDAWGTPYVIEQTPDGGVELRSAGQDRAYSTDDDESWTFAPPSPPGLAVDERLQTEPVAPPTDEAPPEP